MVSQISSGIKISVHTSFEGSYTQNNRLHHAFAYQITIKNLSPDTVQLESRHWDIYDALHPKDVVEGEGVVGQKPILTPGSAYTYQSGCILTSTHGAMQGFYTLLNYRSAQRFRVTIPLFSLSAPFALN